MTPEMLFDYIAVRLNGPKADGMTMSFNVTLTDAGESYMLRLRNAVLSYEAGTLTSGADAAVALTHAALVDLALGTATIEQQLAGGQARVSGDEAKLAALFALLDTFEFWFNIVTP